MTQEISLEERLARLLSDLCASQTTGSVTEAAIKEVETLLAAGANPDARQDGLALLHQAAQQAHPKVVRALLRARATVNCHDETGKTPLHYAVEECQVDVLKELLAYGEPDVRDDDGRTPLLLAMSRMPTERQSGPGLHVIVEALLDHGARPSARDGAGRTAYSYVSELGLLRRLIAADGKLGQPDDVGRLNISGDHASIDGVDADEPGNQLGEAGVPFHVGASRDASGCTPLHYLALGFARRDADRLGQMLEGNVDVARVASEFETSVGLFVRGGGDLNAKNNDGHTPLHFAVDNWQLPARYVSALLAAGADPTAQDERGRSPLHLLGEHDIHTVGVLRALVDGGGDPNCRDRAGITPLYRWLCERDFQEGGAAVIQAFTELGGDPNVRVRGLPPLLHHLAGQEAGHCIEALIARGADPNIQDDGGRTALHHASYVECVDALVTGGALTDLRDADGNTPLHRAIDRRNADTVAALVRAGARIDIPADYSALQCAKDVVPGSGRARGRVTRPDREFNAELVRALLGDLTGEGGVSALVASIEAGEHIEWVRALIAGGADPNACRHSDGQTALHEAVDYVCGTGTVGADAAEMLVALIEAGADPNVRDSKGSTPLHRAASSSRLPGIVRTLLEAGSRAGICDGSGRTPWEVVQGNRVLRRELRNTPAWHQLKEADSVASD